MSGRPRDRLRMPLAAKLGLALVAVAAVLLAFLFGTLGPRTADDFRTRTDELLDRGHGTMRGLAEENVAVSREVLVDLIRHTTESRRRTMADLPLGLYHGDEQRIRAAIAEADAERGEARQRNVDLLTQEMQRRAAQTIETSLDRWRIEQSAMAAALADDVRRRSLWMFAIVYGSLVLFLGLGLYHAIVRPVRRLRQTTQAIQRGELSAEIAVDSSDEVGALAADFVLMVDDLRSSRVEVQNQRQQLEVLNEHLESEVDRKTQHLEDALDDLRRTQRELVHAAKMASVGTLAGGVAHEFNNVIGGIRGCAAEALADEEDGQRREPLEVILRAAERGTQVTRQLLRFSREPVGEKRPLDLEAVLREVLDLAGIAARGGGVRLEKQIAGPLPLLADGGALHQVFLNLATNAVQAEASLLQVEARLEGEEVVCRVRDDGVGIPPEHLDRVFEPFFTTKDDAEDAASRGTGLGLSLSYSIVEGHGGRIEVESRVGEGTCFTIRLPRHRGGES